MNFGRDDYNRNFVDSNGLIPEGEPIFILRGQDKLSPKLLLMWAMDLRLAGGDPKMAEQVERHAQAMIDWQSTHKSKTPDMYVNSEKRVEDLNRIKSIIEDIKLDNPIIFQEISSLMTSYFGPNSLHILLRSDLKSDATSPISLDDFDLNSEEYHKVKNAKLVLFALNSTHFKIVKDGIQ